jgi:TolA-binding protein
MRTSARTFLLRYLACLSLAALLLPLAAESRAQVSPRGLGASGSGASFGPGVSVGAPQSLPATGAFQEAYRAYVDQNYAAAARAFAAHYESDPDGPDAAPSLYYAALSHLAMGGDERARGYFDLFLARFPASPLAEEARLALGTYYVDRRDYRASLDALQRVLDSDPPDDVAANALYWMGESYAGLGEPETALRYYARAAEDYPFTTTAPTAQYTRARTLLDLGRPDDAAEAFAELSRRFSNSAYAQNLGLTLAELYYELGEYEQALDEIERQKRTLTGEALDRATFLQAESSNQLRRSEDAISFYRAFTEDNPDSPYARHARYGLAWNYHMERAYEWAAREFGVVVEGYDVGEDDLAAKARYYQAANLLMLGRPDDAMEGFEDVAEGAPNHDLAPYALFELGATQYAERFWRRANETLGRFVTRYPTHEKLGEALNLLSNTQIALGDFRAAQETFELAIELDAAPRDLRAELRFQRAWLLYRQGDYADAAPAFRAIYEGDPEAENAAQALFWEAESRYQLGDYADATALFRRYLQRYPDGDQVTAAHYALGWTAFKRGAYGDASDAFERFLASYRERDESVPYRTDALLRLGDSYYAQRRFREAIRTYAEVAAEGETYALFQIGQAYHAGDNDFQAITTFRQLLSDFGDSAYREEAQYALGAIFFENQNFDEAISTWEQLVAEAPGDPLAPKALYGIGDAHYNAGRYAAATRAYQGVLERYPRSPFVSEAAAGIQNALLLSEDQEAATATLDSLITANPGTPLADELRYRRAEVLYQSGDVDGALAGFLEVVRTASNPAVLPEAYYYLGTIYAQREQTTEARTYLSTILDTYPSSARAADAARTLGRIYLAQSDGEAALRVYRRMAALPELEAFALAQARLGEGDALTMLGRSAEAQAAYEAVLSATSEGPEAERATLGLAKLYEQQGLFDSALQLYDRLSGTSLDEPGAEALFRRGQLLIRTGETSAGLDVLSRVPTAFPDFATWSARSFLARARANAQLGQRGEALRLYERVERDYDGTEFARTAAAEKAAL